MRRPDRSDTRDRRPLMPIADSALAGPGFGCAWALLQSSIGWLCRGAFTGPSCFGCLPESKIRATRGESGGARQVDAGQQRTGRFVAHGDSGRAIRRGLPGPSLLRTRRRVIHGARVKSGLRRDLFENSGPRERRVAVFGRSRPGEHRVCLGHQSQRFMHAAPVVGADS